jgi:hypothetical protein
MDSVAQQGNAAVDACVFLDRGNVRYLAARTAQADATRLADLLAHALEDVLAS